MCDSPIYDPNNKFEAGLPCKPEMVGIDGDREFKDEGIYPGPGSYHMYHRINGRLVACGVIDICDEVLNSAYFMYDPSFKKLNLGVIGALIEIEYMKLIQQKYNPKMRYYHLGELNINCPKVNYKLNYGPGALILCP
jgi:arginine-tRNA-protein transferase